MSENASEASAAFGEAAAAGETRKVSRQNVSQDKNGIIRAKTKTSRTRLWTYRLLAMTLGPVVFFLAIELLLGQLDYGAPTSFFLERPQGGETLCVENKLFARRFFPKGLAREPLPLAFPEPKANDTYRIFVLGESAAMGFPSPSFSFSRILEAMLSERFPGLRFEVINVAMTAINSHVVLPIARECAEREPDLFVIYMGNNEVVGPYGAAGVLGPGAPPLALVRGSIGVKETRTGQLLGDLLGKIGGKKDAAEWDGMEMFVKSRVRLGDERLERVYRHYETNLEEIIEAGRESHAPVIACTVASNLRSAPFGSAPPLGLSESAARQWQNLFEEGVQAEEAGDVSTAIDRYEQANELFDGSAELHFRLARLVLSHQRPEDARKHFLKARELDTLRFRADSRLNEIVRKVVARKNDAGVHLVDIEEAFASQAADGIPGDEYFFEHVHLTFAGNYAIARSVFEETAPLLREKYAMGEPVEAPSEEECKKRLGYTDWNEWNSFSAVALLFDAPPFDSQIGAEERTKEVRQRIEQLEERLAAGGAAEAIEAYRHALTLSPDDAQLHMDVGQLLMSHGAFPQATRHFQEVQQALPHHPSPHIMLAHAYGAQGQAKEAFSHCARALAIDPESAQAIELKQFLRERFAEGAKQ
jgi:tetratricopeptide (TPR) repeat protein